VEVVSATEDVNSATPEGELTLTMVMAVGQYQIAVIGRSWRTTIRSNKAQGWWHGATPFGYRRPTKAEANKIGRSSGVILVDDVDAEHVRELFRRYLAGESLYMLGKEAVRRGWFARVMTVKDVLNNPAYAGMIPVDGEYSLRQAKRGDRRVLKDNHGRPLRKRITVRYLKGRHVPIVSPKDVVRARSRLAAEAKHAPGPHPEARWSAAGLTRCGTCRRLLTFHDKSHVANSGTYLLCGNQRCVDRPGSVRVPELELHLEALVRRLAVTMNTEVTARALENERRRMEISADRGALEARRTRLKSAIARAAAERLLADGDRAMSTDEIDAGLGVLRKDLDEISSLLEHLPQPKEHEALAHAAANTENVASLWPRMTYDERAAALRSIGAIVMVAPSRKHGDKLDGRVWIEGNWQMDHAASSSVALSS
jgi:DNA invertase Pin-like site-specific DNA recombinase